MNPQQIVWMETIIQASNKLDQSLSLKKHEFDNINWGNIKYLEKAIDWAKEIDVPAYELLKNCPPLIPIIEVKKIVNISTQIFFFHEQIIDNIKAAKQELILTPIPWDRYYLLKDIALTILETIAVVKKISDRFNLIKIPNLN